MLIFPALGEKFAGATSDNLGHLFSKSLNYLAQSVFESFYRTTPLTLH